MSTSSQPGDIAAVDAGASDLSPGLDHHHSNGGNLSADSTDGMLTATTTVGGGYANPFNVSVGGPMQPPPPPPPYPVVFYPYDNAYNTWNPGHPGAPQSQQPYHFEQPQLTHPSTYIDQRSQALVATGPPPPHPTSIGYGPIRGGNAGNTNGSSAGQRLTTYEVPMGYPVTGEYQKLYQQ